MAAVVQLDTVEGLANGTEVTFSGAGATSIAEILSVANIDYFNNTVTFDQDFINAQNPGSQAIWTSSTASPATEPRYRSCFAHKHTDDHKDVIAGLLACFDGWLSPRSDGALMIFSGRYSAPTVSIGPDEIVSYSIQDGIDEESAVNQITLTYVSSNHKYNTVDTDPWEDDDDISDRGKVLSQQLANQVPSFSQARRLAKRKMAQIMAPERGTITTNAAGRKVRGQRFLSVNLTEAGVTFYSGPVEVTKLVRNIATGGVTFDWIAADPNIDAWEPDTEEGYPAPVGNRIAPAPLAAPTIISANKDLSAINGDGTGVRVHIVGAGPADRSDLIWFGRWRVQGAAVWNEARYPDLDDSQDVALDTSFVPALATVEVEIAYEVADGRVSPYSPAFFVDTHVGSPLTDAVADAAETADWPNVADPAGTKPDDNATVGATIGVDLKLSSGLLADTLAIINPALTLAPDGRLIQTTPAVGDIPAVTSVLGTLALPALGAASDSARRQLESDLASLSAAITQLTVGQSIVQNVFRDAGLSTDPATGTARLFAVEQTKDQLTSLSVTLNAALGTLGLKADVNYVDQAILAAQLGGQTADLNAVFVRLTGAEATINGLAATVVLKADATIVSGLQGTVSAVQSSIDAINVTLSQTASQTAVTAQEVRLTAAEQTLQAMDGASISQAVSAARYAPANSDAAGAANIIALLGSDAANQDALTGIANARQDISARVDGQFAAAAVISQQLSVQIASAMAQIANDTATRITGDQASAAALAAFQTTMSGNLASINTAIGTVSTAQGATAQSLSDFKTATAGNLGTITQALSSVTTQASSTAQALTTFETQTGQNLTTITQSVSSVTTAQTSTAQSLADYKASTNGSLATITSNLTAVTNSYNATAAALSTFATNVNGTLADFSQRFVTQSSTNSALAGEITTIGTTLDDHSSTLTTYGSSIDGLLLKYGVEFNSDGHITGFALNGGGGRTDAVFVVTNFKIAQPSGGAARTVFEVADDGTVKMPNVEVDTLTAGSVDARELVGSAVQQVVFSMLANTVTIGPGS